MPQHAARNACARSAPAIDPRLDEVLRGAIAIGTAIVVLLPAARGAHAVIGWLPLWLVAMPAMAWWALHRFPLPRFRATRDAALRPAARSVRRVAGVQARRRARPVRGGRLPHAA